MQILGNVNVVLNALPIQHQCLSFYEKAPGKVPVHIGREPKTKQNAPLCFEKERITGSYGTRPAARSTRPQIAS